MADLKKRVFRVKIIFFIFLQIYLKFLLWVDINAE